MNITLALVGNNMTEQKQKFNYGSRTILFSSLYIIHNARFVCVVFLLIFMKSSYPYLRVILSFIVLPSIEEILLQKQITK